MQVYVLRLLLEYARICDERREYMGWVEDIVGNSGHSHVGAGIQVDAEG